jgi:hypothetical protein
MKLEDIPAEVRWEIASKAFVNISMGYDMAFRQILGKEVVIKIEEAIWAEGGKDAKNIAANLGLPAQNAAEVSAALGIVSMIFNGKWDYKTIEKTEERSVDHFTNCPILNAYKETETPVISMPHVCQAYNTSGIEALNPKYTQRFTKRMCTGDDYCESIVELK